MRVLDNKNLFAWSKIALGGGILVWSLAFASSVLAAAPQLSVKNNTHTTYSAGGTFAAATLAAPGDTLEFQMFGNNNSATSLSITLPADLAYAGTSAYGTGATAAAAAVGPTITWSFGANNFAIIRWTAVVVSGANLSASHNLSVFFATNAAVNSNNVAVITGPIITSIAPVLANNANAVGLTITGHGFTQTADINSLRLEPGNIDIAQSLVVSGPDGSGNYTITGARVPAGVAAGTYYIVITTHGYNGTLYGDSLALANQANANESAAYVVDLAAPAVTNFNVSQGDNISGTVKDGSVVISAAFSEALSVAPHVAIDQPGSVDVADALMAAGAGNVYTYTYTARAADGSQYIDGPATVAVSLGADMAGNVMAGADYTFIIDTTAGSVAISDLAASPVDNSSLQLSFTLGAIDPDFGQFKAFYSTSPGVDVNTGLLATSTTSSFSITGLAAGSRYYAVVYACDIAGNCSAASNEASARVYNYFITLSKGWNLISFPVTPDDSDWDAVLGATAGNINAIWSYNGDWLVYHPDLENQSNLSSITPGFGYWLDYAADAAATLAGYGAIFSAGNSAPPQRTLPSGWSLIGYFDEFGLAGAPVSAALRNNLYNIEANSPRWSSLLGYDNASQQFTELNGASSIYSGRGYWVLLPGAGSDRYIYTVGARP